jgi:hypothetical protein
MGESSDQMYRIIDTKVGVRQSYSSREEALEALRAWIEMQRKAGERVIEQDDGQWKDSRMTVWVCDPGEHIVRLVGEPRYA